MYYLFIIKDNFFYNNQKYLYDILYKIKHMSKENYIYGINLYYDICKTFDIDVLKYYLESKYNFKNIGNKYYLDKYNYFSIRRSACTINNDAYIREILCIFYIYNKNIFICNFDNEEYFFIKDKFK